MTVHVLNPSVHVRSADDDDGHISEKVESVRPPEILCRILQLAVGPDGVKALLPFTRVSAHWRRAALGDSSLWTTIYLEQTTIPLLDMILAHAGGRLLMVHADRPDLNRFEKLWKLVDRIEELHYSTGLEQLTPFLSSLGPAPNLKVLDLRPASTTGTEEPAPVISLPVIFSSCLPSLRDLTLTNVFIWPTGLFRGLTSLECGAHINSPIVASCVLDVLRESPSIKFIHLVGCCTFPPTFASPTVALPSLGKCILVGQGTTHLVRFITVPASALVSLRKPFLRFGDRFPKFDDLSVAPGLHVLDDVSTVSLSISDHAVQLRAKNDHGGLDAEVDELYDLSRDPVPFIHFIRSFFECGRAFSGSETTKEFTLNIERGRSWNPEEAKRAAFDITKALLNLPSIEEANLCGVPPLELSLILESLSKLEFLCPNLKRLHIESVPLPSPRSLLVALDKLLTGRKERGVPFQSITVKAKCEMLIPATDHCAFLTSWESLVGGGVRLEYEQTEVKKLRKCHREDEWDDYEDEESEEEDEDEDEEAGTGDPSCVGWDGWPEKWPKVIGEMGGT
jgi:hypothetical protein